MVKKPKLPKVKKFKLISDCIENGVSMGWKRAHKHTDTPTEDGIKTCMEEEIMYFICEAFDFEEK